MSDNEHIDRTGIDFDLDELKTPIRNKVEILCNKDGDSSEIVDNLIELLSDNGYYNIRIVIDGE